jgi:hypothetical protein
MAVGWWKVIRGAHKSASDSTLHVLTEVGGDRQHLRLDGSGCVSDITFVRAGQPLRLSGHLPWTGTNA